MEIKIALAGNPNCGKTTLFNALTGANQFVGNWPGVTVEKKEGRLKGEKDVIITDLPGIYSLSPYTMEEVVARNVLIDQRPDALLNIIDATNLERNLYLTTQLAELGIPMVVALNMMDVVRKNGDRIDAAKLSNHLGVPVIEISALKGDGVMEAAQRAVQMARSGKKTIPAAAASPAASSMRWLTSRKSCFTTCRKSSSAGSPSRSLSATSRLIEKLNISKDKLTHIEQDIPRPAKRKWTTTASPSSLLRATPTSLSIIDGCVKKSNRGMSTSDKIDRVLTNRILGLPIFAAIMTLVYYIAISTVGTALTDWTNDVFVGEWILPAAQSFFEGIGCADWLTGLIVDGVISGVGAVLGFVPQMLVLFLELCILEDCGYMARIAFIMDRVFRRFGLSGKNFIPMLVGTGCGVPGVMASRTIEQERDRRMTIMTTTFIPCGAKMPIVGLMAGAIFGGAWWVAPSAYFVGIAAIIISGIILKKTKPFAGEPAPFVMELPAYHVPTVKNVLRGTWERGWSFIKKAGTIITLSSVFVWFTSSFGFVDGAFGMVEDMDASILAAIGNAVCFIFKPLGFGNWQATVATLLGLVAKEEVVGAFGTLFAVAGDALEMVEEGDFAGLVNIAAQFTQLSAYSFLIFNLLCAPCFAAIGAIKREMNNAKWTWAAIGWECGFAYAVALIVYQIGGLFTGDTTFGVGTVAAVIVLGVLIYLIVRPYKESEEMEVKYTGQVISPLNFV